MCCYVLLLFQSHVATETVDGDHDEADEWQTVADVHAWQTEEYVLCTTCVDDGSLEWWHECSTNDCHHEEGCTKG